MGGMTPRTSKKVAGFTSLAGAALFGVISLQRVPAPDALIPVSGPLVSVTPAQGGKYGAPLRFEIR